METQDILIKIFTLFFIVFFYVILVLWTSDVIEDDLSRKRWRKIFYSISAEFYLDRYKKQLIVIGSLIFPFYYMFSYGWIFGQKFYDILIDNKDEDRIASWLF